jgi:hypothetical protein
MSGNSGSQGAWSDFDGGLRFNRDSLVRELDAVRYVAPRDVPADATPPMTASELYELKRLIRKYPDLAREELAALDGT